MSEVNLVEAIRMALARAMEDDPSVLVLGEDVGRDGGVFRATDGLLARFGAARVFDTPVSEALLTGLAVGLGAQRFRPVVEFQFEGFMYPAIDQLVCHAGRLRNRTRGRLSCPIVLRAPYGGGIKAPEHHSESPEAFYAHIPGIRTVIPSSPRAAYGLLLAAIREEFPFDIIAGEFFYPGGPAAVALARRFGVAASVTARPPVLLVHGSADELIPVQALFHATQTLAALEIPTEWHISHGIGHGIDGEGLRHGGEFLARHFKIAR